VTLSDAIFNSRPGLSLSNGIIYNAFGNAPYTSYSYMQPDSIAVNSTRADNNSGAWGINSNVQKDVLFTIGAGYFYARNYSSDSSGNATAIYAEAVTDEGEAWAGDFVGNVRVSNVLKTNTISENIRDVGFKFDMDHRRKKIKVVLDV
jgi:hypothetical protein